jgi:hypothetical protein
MKIPARAFVLPAGIVVCKPVLMPRSSQTVKLFRLYFLPWLPRDARARWRNIRESLEIGLEEYPMLL